MSQSSGYEVGAEDRGRVRVFTLERPEKLNAFTAEGYRALRQRLEAAAADDGVAACVITGRGRAFSAGVDLSVMGVDGGPQELGRQFDPLLTALAQFPKPLIAAVNGLAVGFGATLLLHCDLVIVAEGAEIKMPFIKLGTCAEAGSSWLLPRRVGMQQALWLVLSGQGLDAHQAVETGFALAVAPAGGAVDEAVGRGQLLAEHATPALIANKRLLREGWAEQIELVWEREKRAMADMASVVGPIGWAPENR